MNDIIKRVIGFDAYGYISKAIKNGDIQNIDVWLNSPSPTGYKGTQDLQEAAKRVDESLLDLAFATQNKEIIQRILKSECANLHSVNKKDSHNALANILLQEKQEDREEFFQIIKDKLNERDYINLLAANKVTDLLPRLFKLAGGIDPKIAQAMFEKAVRDGYQKSALLLFNQFPEIDLSFKTDIKMRATSLYDDNIDEKNISPLKNLIYKIQNYSIFHKDDNDDQAEIRSLLLTLLKNGDLNKLESNLLYDLFAGSETSSDLELIESLQDLNLIKRLIRTKGFKISDENQFAGELLQTTDEIFHASITELHKKNMLSEKLITALVQKISLQSTPAYKKNFVA